MKSSTSIQYQITNKVLFDNIFLNWNKFDEALSKGPDYMRNYLVNEWNRYRDFLLSKDDLMNQIDIKDMDRVVSEEDFDVQGVMTKSNVFVFFFSFPDYEEYVDYESGFVDPVSKYVALAMTDDLPRYFTFEYSYDAMTNEPRFVIGEFYVDGNELAHRNYGSIEEKSLEQFAALVCQYIDSEKDKDNKE